MPKLKSIDYIKFDLFDDFAEEKLSCDFEFIFQSPLDPTLCERAILIKMDSNDSETFHLHISCRIVYAFESKDSIPEDKEFLQQNYLHAYSVFRKKTNEVLEALNKAQLPFPELD